MPFLEGKFRPGASLFPTENFISRCR